MPFEDRCEKEVSLARLGTFGIGGPASLVFKALTVEDVQDAMRYAWEQRCPLLILGKGSNCLFSDSGFPGLVVVNKIDTIQGKGAHFEVGGGASFAALGRQTAHAGWSGLEFAAGIPGTVGGAIYMNAGAAGQQVADCLQGVSFVDQQGNLHQTAADTLSFSYRWSSFQNNDCQEKTGMIVAAQFTLLPSQDASQDARKRQDEMMAYRRRTQPLHERSAGCVFRNSKSVSAGKLIEEAGLKGMRIGDAEVSNMHANFIVNKGKATASDVVELIEHIQGVVAQKTGILLKREIRLIEVPCGEKSRSTLP